MRKHWKGIKVQAIRVTNVKVDMHRYDHLSAFMKNLYKIKSKLSISPEEMAKVYTALCNLPFQRLFRFINRTDTYAIPVRF